MLGVYGIEMACMTKIAAAGLLLNGRQVCCQSFYDRAGIILKGLVVKTKGTQSYIGRNRQSALKCINLLLQEEHKAGLDVKCIGTYLYFLSYTAILWVYK